MARISGSNFGHYSLGTSGSLTTGNAYLDYTTSTTNSAVTITYSLYATRHFTSTSQAGATGGITVRYTTSTPTSGSGTIKFSVSTSGTKTVTLLSSKTITYSRTTSAQTKTLSFSVTETTSGKTSSGSASISVPALPTFYFYYNNNGGKGAIANQAKQYNQSATLNNGSAFSKTGTLNGAVTKGKLLSWNTKADGTGSSYPLGGTAPNISANTTLYAIWDATYWVYPKITESDVRRTATSSLSDTDDDDMGQYLYIRFNWDGYVDKSVDSSVHPPSCKITVDSDEYTVTLSGTSGTVEYKPSIEYSRDSSHAVIIELYNPDLTTQKTVVSAIVGTAIMPIDLYGNGNDVWMGIMTAYQVGQQVTMPDTYVDDMHITLDDTTSSGTDYNIISHIGEMDSGWADCITS